MHDEILHGLKARKVGKVAFDPVSNQMVTMPATVEAAAKEELLSALSAQERELVSAPNKPELLHKHLLTKSGTLFLLLLGALWMSFVEAKRFVRPRRPAA